MIEPQNTMLPLAESRPVEARQGDGEGFGEMLAQSLGMVPQVDPSAVQQINPGLRQGHSEGESEASSEEPDLDAAAALGAGPATPTGIAVPNASATIDPPDPSGAQHESQAHEVVPSLARTVAAQGQRFSRSRNGVEPVQVLPTPPAADATPHVDRPIDTAWNPSPLMVSEEVSADPTARADGNVTPQPAGPLDAISESIVGAEPTIDKPDVVPTTTTARPNPNGPVTPARAPGIDPPGIATVPDNPHSISSDSVLGEVAFEPAVAEPEPTAVERGANLPGPPAIDTAHSGAETTAGTVEANRATAPPPVTRAQPRVDLAPDRPIHLDTGPAATAVEQPAAVESAGIGISTTDPAAAPTGPVATSPETLRPQASALAERVMQAIDLQRTQPPPRSMVVDIPELEGLRLVVSVRAAGHVTVTPASGSGNPDAFAPFASDLSRVLAERGFVMNGDGRQRGYNPYADEEPVPATPRRGSFRRPTRVDNDLRI